MAEALLCRPPTRPRSQLAARTEFENLMRATQGRILRLAQGILNDRDAAEDVVQETFVRTFRAFDGFRNEAAFSTWAYRIAANLCFDARRKQRPTESIDDMEESIEPQDWAPGPEALMNVRELARHTDEALDRLSPAHRAILLLREVEGLSYAQIAEVLQIPKGTVMSRLHHARLKIQRIYGEIVGNDEANA
jgi:RNA polymerase sigma-70 factor, ECF subfamily